MFRAKVYVQKKTEVGYQPHGVTAPVKQTPQVNVEMVPVLASDIPEDRNFSIATPGGKIELFITNPVVIDQIEAGKLFYVDFTEVGVPFSLKALLDGTEQYLSALIMNDGNDLELEKDKELGEAVAKLHSILRERSKR